MESNSKIVALLKDYANSEQRKSVIAVAESDAASETAGRVSWPPIVMFAYVDDIFSQDLYGVQQQTYLSTRLARAGVKVASKADVKAKKATDAEYEAYNRSLRHYRACWVGSFDYALDSINSKRIADGIDPLPERPKANKGNTTTKTTPTAPTTTTVDAKPGFVSKIDEALSRVATFAAFFGTLKISKSAAANGREELGKIAATLQEAIKMVESPTTTTIPPTPPAPKPLGDALADASKTDETTQA